MVRSADKKNDYLSCPVTLLPVNYFSKARNYAWIPAQHQDQNLHVMASRHLNNVRLASHGLDNQSNVQLVGNGKHTPSVLEESPIKRRGRFVQKQFWHAPPSDADRMVAPPPRRRDIPASDELLRRDTALRAPYLLVHLCRKRRSPKWSWQEVAALVEPK